MPANIRSSRTRSSAPREIRPCPRSGAAVSGCFILGAVAAVIFFSFWPSSSTPRSYLGKVHAGVTVSGIELGGMTPEKAKAALDKRVKDAQKSRVTLDQRHQDVEGRPRGRRNQVRYRRDGRLGHGRVAQEHLHRRPVSRLPNVLQAHGRPAARHGRLRQDGPGRRRHRPIGRRASHQRRAGVRQGQQVKIVRGQKGRVVDRKALASQLETVLLSLQAAGASGADDREGAHRPGGRLRSGPSAGHDDDRRPGDTHQRQRLVDPGYRGDHRVHGLQGARARTAVRSGALSVRRQDGARSWTRSPPK